MKFATYTHEGTTHYGAITDQGAIPLSPHFPDWPTLKEAIAAGGLPRLAEAATGHDATHQNITYQPPIPAPTRIICVGVNFPDRNAEYKDGTQQPQHMSLFPRFPSSFTGHDQPLIRPPESHKLDYEGEVAVVIGKAGRRIAPEDAYTHIAALTLCNEGTIRDWVRHAKFNVTQGKNWDKSGALGPWIVPFTDAAQLDEVHLTTHVNGELRQDDHLANMMFPVREEIAYISTFTTLEPGDIIITGTPTGAGARFDPPKFLKPGDVVEVSATCLGTLRNQVADE